MSGKTVFISYRRDVSGKSFARAIKQELTHEGYDVFLDVDSIDAGEWEKQVVDNVRKHAHFLLLLTPQALEKCTNVDDWVRREYELASQYQRNIVPVLEESVHSRDIEKECPESMKSLLKYQFATVRHGSFAADIDTLARRYISPASAPKEESIEQTIVSNSKTARKALILFVHNLLPASHFEDRPELHLLCDWWRSRKGGVITLWGMGGAGKSALVDKFIRMIPNMLPKVFGNEKAISLEQPTGLFVFSFYAGDETAFFSHLYSWYTDLPLTAKAPSYTQLIFDLQTRTSKTGHRSVLVLDGLEKVQSNEPGKAFGELLHDDLRNFLSRVASGTLPSFSIIITTRFPIPGFNDPGYREIRVDMMPEPSIIKLLESRGLRGTNEDLRRIALLCGYHALTVDLVAAYIAEFENGNANVGFHILTSEELDEKLFQELESNKRRVWEQEKALLNIGRRYRERLGKRDPLILSVLEILCFSYRELESKQVLRQLSISDAEDLNNRLKIGLDEVKFKKEASEEKQLREIEKILNFLSGLGLIQKTSRSEPYNYESKAAYRTKYLAHIAIREPFIKSIPPVLEERAHHAAIRAVQLELPDDLKDESPKDLVSRVIVARLSGKAIRIPTDLVVLKALSEIVYHLIALGQKETAWQVYSKVIGGYKTLSKTWDTSKLGLEIITSLSQCFKEEQSAHVFLEYSSFIEAFQRLSRACRYYRSVVQPFLKQGKRYQASYAKYRLARILIACDSLPVAKEILDESRAIMNNSEYAYFTEDGRSSSGQGPEELIEELAAYINLLNGRQVALDRIWQSLSVEWCNAALFLGRYDDVKRICEIAIENLEQMGDGIDKSRESQWRLMLAESNRCAGDMKTSERLLDEWKRRYVNDCPKYDACMHLLFLARLETSKYLQTLEKETPHGNAESLKRTLTQAIDGLSVALQYEYNSLSLEVLIEISGSPEMRVIKYQ